MKYTIEGFSQAEMVKHNMDCIDAVILRWFIDFKDGGRMFHEIIEGEKYYWVKYSQVLKDLPILKLGKEALARRFIKMAEAENNILSHYTKKESGTFSMYSVGKDYILLVDTSDGTTLKSDGYDSKVGRGTILKSDGYDSKVGTNNSSISNSSISDKSIKNNNISEFENFWNVYNKKIDKTKCEKEFAKIKEDISVVIEKAKLYVNSTPDIKFRKNPLTWLNGKCWNDEIKLKSENKVNYDDGVFQYDY